MEGTPRYWGARRFLYDLRCGVHSGIPLCCLAWYVGPWRLVSRTWLRGLYWSRIPEGFDHVGCPWCVYRGTPVVLRDCACASGDWVARILLDLDDCR